MQNKSNGRRQYGNGHLPNGGSLFPYGFMPVIFHELKYPYRFIQFTGNRALQGNSQVVDYQGKPHFKKGTFILVR